MGGRIRLIRRRNLAPHVLEPTQGGNEVLRVAFDGQPSPPGSLGNRSNSVAAREAVNNQITGVSQEVDEELSQGTRHARGVRVLSNQSAPAR